MTFLGICVFRRKSALSELSSILWVKRKKIKELYFFFFLTILRKIVTIHGLYLMALWHPQAPLGRILGSAPGVASTRPTPLSQTSALILSRGASAEPGSQSSRQHPGASLLEFRCSK